MAALSTTIKAESARLGFAACGIVPIAPARTHGFYRRWLAAGFAGAMGYLHRHTALKQDPRALLPEARSVIVLAHPYAVAEPDVPPDAGTARGRVSRYAHGTDYHDVLHQKLERLAAFIADANGAPIRHRACVDSAPLLEREWAARAGLGWVGRNAMLIHWRLGSWLFLAELLVDLPLAADTAPPPRKGSAQRRLPPPADAPELIPADLGLRESCGSCTACIEACPTGAIVGDQTVDARRCISYLTIELKGPVPEHLRHGMGDWVFGCDICQDVCPWNRRAASTDEPAFQGDAESARPSLTTLLGMDDASFRERYRHTPLWRPRRRGLLRNAAIALGNRLAGRSARSTAPTRDELDALRRALSDPEPLVRGAVAWALGQTAHRRVRPWLATALESETDPHVREELQSAKSNLG